MIVELVVYYLKCMIVDPNYIKKSEKFMTYN